MLFVALDATGDANLQNVFVLWFGCVMKFVVLITYNKSERDLAPLTDHRRLAMITYILNLLQSSQMFDLFMFSSTTHIFFPRLV